MMAIRIMKNNSKRKPNITDTTKDEIIFLQGGISLLIKAHDNGIEFRLLSVDIEQLTYSIYNELHPPNSRKLK